MVKNWCNWGTRATTPAFREVPTPAGEGARVPIEYEPLFIPSLFLYGY